MDEANKINFTYPMLRSPNSLTDNMRQVEAIASEQEARLIKNNRLPDYNAAVQEFVDKNII